VLAKDGNKLKYTDKTGKEHKYFRSGITNELLDLIMQEWDENKVVANEMAKDLDVDTEDKNEE